MDISRRSQGMVPMVLQILYGSEDSGRGRETDKTLEGHKKTYRADKEELPKRGSFVQI